MTAELSDPIGEAFAECLLLLENTVHISRDMQTLGDMKNYPLLAFGQPGTPAVQQLPSELSYLVIHNVPFPPSQRSGKRPIPYPRSIGARTSPQQPDPPRRLTAAGNVGDHRSQ